VNVLEKQEYEYQYTRFLSLLIILIVIISVMLSACDSKKNVWPPCEPLTVVDGYKTVKVKEDNFTLKLPDYTDVRRRSVGEWGCDYADNIFIDYLWYDGKLIPWGENRFKVPVDQVVKLLISLKFSGYVEEDRNRYHKAAESDNDSWRFEDALAHKRYPLEYYPKLFWDDPVNPSETALKRARLDSVWGIRNTNYKDVITDRPFSAFCRIPPLDASDLNSRIESDFDGSGHCRGRISGAKDGKYLHFLIDVSDLRGHGRGHEGMTEINLIYDAVVEKIQSFIKE
jgi:hypothetical protein